MGARLALLLLVASAMAPLRCPGDAPAVSGAPRPGVQGDTAGAGALLNEAEARLAEYKQVLAELKAERERREREKPAMALATGGRGWAVWAGLGVLVILCAPLGWLLRGRVRARRPHLPVVTSGAPGAPPRPEASRRAGAAQPAPDRPAVPPPPVTQVPEPGPPRLDASVQLAQPPSPAVASGPSAAGTAAPPVLLDSDGAGLAEATGLAPDSAADAAVTYAALRELAEGESARAMLQDALARSQQQLADLRAASAVLDADSAAVQQYVAADLQRAGYLDLGADPVSLVADPAGLRAALACAARDGLSRSEMQYYVRTMTALRAYLADPDMQGLAWFRAAGLHRVAASLGERQSFQSLYSSDTPRDALLGQWSVFLADLFRAVLLFDTYWPRADPGLRRRLGLCREAARLLLWLHGIEPHELVLPVPRTWLDERPWAQLSPVRALDPELAADPVFQKCTADPGESGPLLRDVARWGYTLAGANEPQDAPSLLR